MMYASFTELSTKRCTRCESKKILAFSNIKFLNQWFEGIKYAVPFYFCLETFYAIANAINQRNVFFTLAW